MAYQNITRLFYDSVYPFNNTGNIYKVYCLLGAVLNAFYMLSLENVTEVTEAERRLLSCPASNSWLNEI